MIRFPAMAKVLQVAALVAALTACSKSRCEKYADMEIKCGGIPKSEEAMTRKLAEGMCESADSEKSEISNMFKAEAECAAKHSDCAGYEACTKAAANPK
jgi:hypothetical protein